MATVSLYIPCYNGAQYIEGCFAALAQQIRQPDEILFIDDGSTDGSAEMAEKFPGVRVIRHGTNRGLAAARNTALREAQGELIASLDVDCVADRGWLMNLMAGLKALPGAVGAGGMLEEAYQETLGDRFRAFHMPQHHGDKASINPRILAGANTIYRRDVLLALGGYNESFRTNGEDTDLCKRLYAAEHSLIYQPNALVKHMRQDTVASVLRMQWKHSRYPTVVYDPPVGLKGLIRYIGKQIRAGVAYRFWPNLKARRWGLAYVSFLYLFYAPYMEIGAWGENNDKKVPLADEVEV